MTNQSAWQDTWKDSINQRFIPQKGVSPENGRLTDQENSSAIFEPVWVGQGAVIRARKDDAIRIFYYSPEIRPELIHTYDYDPESNYTIFVPDFYPNTYTGQESAVITRSGYIRIALNTETDALLTERIEIIPSTKPQPAAPRSDLTRSIAEKLEQQRNPEDAVFILLTDTHYGCGCRFENTADSILNLAALTHPDAIIHLGDLTDGSQTGEWTKKYAARVMSALRKACAPCYFLLGNHDSNYHRGNPNVFSEEECEDFYFEGEPENRIKDLKEKKLRLIFLGSFDPKEKHRYGFSMKTVFFLLKAVFTTPKGYRVIVFSHVPPLGEIHYWDKHIRNSGKIIFILEQSQKWRKNILAYIHGHNHADQVYRAKSFPIIGISSSKIEDFQDRKPEGSITWPRNPDDSTADLFDLLLVKEERLEFFRYGAGEDRTVSTQTKKGANA